MPTRLRCSGAPTPDSCRICGEFTAPAERITSRSASARSTAPPRSYSTATARRRPVHLRGKERTTAAAHRGLAALPVLGLLEERQDVVPAPAAIAELSPMIKILGLAADIDQPVDRAGAAEHPAARVQDRASGGPGIGLGVIAPGQCRVIEHLHKTRRDVDVGA